MLDRLLNSAESGPHVPPTSSLDLCMTDPSQNDRVSSLNNELCLYCTYFPFANITYAVANMRIFMIENVVLLKLEMC